MIYYVIELQSGDAGGVVPMAFTSYDDAEEYFFQVAKATVKSAVRCHTVLLIDENGFILKGPEIHKHRG